MLITLNSATPQAVRAVGNRVNTIAVGGEQDVLVNTDSIESIRRVGRAQGHVMEHTLIRTKTGGEIAVMDRPRDIAARIAAAVARRIDQRNGGGK